MAQEVEDAVQEDFLALLEPNGGLERLDQSLGSSFRAFLYGVARNTALRVETRRGRELNRRSRENPNLDEQATQEATLSRIFDREWARSILKAATQRQLTRAQSKGVVAVRRVELLRLRFQEGKPIREIAQMWQVDAAHLHQEYAHARKEFVSALREVIGLEEGGTKDALAKECARILELLE